MSARLLTLPSLRRHSGILATREPEAGRQRSPLWVRFNSFDGAILNV
jgi:hypothetical protein